MCTDKEGGGGASLFCVIDRMRMSLWPHTVLLKRQNLLIWVTDQSAQIRSDFPTGVSVDYITCQVVCPCTCRWFPALPHQLLHQLTLTWNPCREGKFLVCFFCHNYKQEAACKSFKWPKVQSLLVTQSGCIICPVTRCQHRAKQRLRNLKLSVTWLSTK